MKRCPSEGELRAYLDGELPSVQMQRMTAHQAGCPRCAALTRHLAERGARVSALLSVLPEPEPVTSIPALPFAAGRRWTPAFALAACALIAVTYISVPSRDRKGALQRAAPAPVTASVPDAFRGAAPLVRGLPPSRPSGAESRVQGRLARRPRASTPAVRGAGLGLPSEGRLKPAPPRASEVRYFISLDNEPVDFGTVMRVALGPSELPADVVFGPDGRARAIRLVSDRY